METSAKVMAYLRASDVVWASRSVPGLYDRATATAINRELKEIAKRLKASAQKIYNEECIQEQLDKDPALKKRYEDAQKGQRYRNAEKTQNRIVEELKREKEQEAEQ